MCECVRQGASLHDKKVVPILRILGTDATYYLLLSTFIFFFSLLSVSNIWKRSHPISHGSMVVVGKGGWGFNLSEIEIFPPPPLLLKKEKKKESATLNTIPTMIHLR